MSQTTQPGAVQGGGGAPRQALPVDETALQYESLREAPSSTEPRGRRPIWVWVLVVLYCLIVLGLLAVAVGLPLAEEDSFAKTIAGLAGLLMLCAVGLIFVPVRMASRRPMSRRALWIPIAASGGLGAMLVGGALLAILEWQRWDNEANLVLLVVPAVWLLWCVIFGIISSRRLPEAVAAKLHRWVLAGSVLELLVAVPTHLVVRRREECCAGVLTGMGICIGVVVMLLAFGPSVGFLYYRRWQKVRKPPALRGRLDASADAVRN